MTTEPTQPLTDEELDAMRGRHELEWIEPPDRVICDFDVPWCRECGEQHPCEVACLLAEVDRLRAENTALAERIAAVRAIEPRQRTGLTTPTLLAEVSGWNGAVATLRSALGLDQDGNGNG